MKTLSIFFIILMTTTVAVAAQHVPNMPTKNPFLAEGPYPTSHDNSGATDSVLHAGPTQGRQLTDADVKTVPASFVSNPTVKKIGNDLVVIASGSEGIRKIKATGKSFELVSFLPYPNSKFAPKATDEALEKALKEADAAYRSKDDAKITALSKQMAEIGFGIEAIANNGVYNFIDKDGFHYAVFGGMGLIKTTDDNKADSPLRIAAAKDLAKVVPPELRKSHIVGMGMTYDGHIVAAPHGGVLYLDRDLNLLGTLLLPGEDVENSICIDESGIYVVTSRRMLKLVWTGSKLSFAEADGGWQSEYNTMSPEKAKAAGALTVSGGSGTTPTLMGFGNDPDKLVLISDADENGANLVAFWRNEIPADFKQIPGTKSRRIAGQIRTEISKVTVEPSVAVLGYGALLLNGAYPKPEPDIWTNAMTSGVTRPAPFGIIKFTWDPARRVFAKEWINKEIDNTDVMVPVISAASQMVYLATKKDGRYAYVGVDWMTGETKAVWLFPDESRKWNAYGGITALLEDGDLLMGGGLAIKRLLIGEGGK